MLLNDLNFSCKNIAVCINLINDKHINSILLTGEFHCGFEDGNICLFTQDDTDNFDWTKQSTATRNTKYTPNTGPNADRSGSKEGRRV